jgi:hypothetical protein
MKSITARALCIAACFFWCQYIAAQGCGVVMSRFYSVYHTETVDQSKVYTSVLLDGYATCTQTLSCPCGSATHHPVVNNKIGTVGGQMTGANTCVSCYMSLQNNQSAPAVAGQRFTYQGGGNVICSIVGSFYSNLFNIQLEVAYTRAYGGSPGTDCFTAPATHVTTCTYAVNDWCNAATSPPDFSQNGGSIRDTSPRPLPIFWDTIATCVRNGTSGPWLCGHGFGIVVGQGVFPFPLAACTRNP